MDTEGAARRLAAIMFTDIVGYTALMAESEERGLRVRARHRALVRPLVESHRGESIEAKGDESLSVFPNVLDAVRCALEIEDRLREELDLRLHIGIHLGDVVVRDGEVSGDGVNIASRICALSPEGGIRISGEVHRAIRNQPDVGSVALGEQKLKNVGQPVAVFAVGRPGTLAGVRRRVRWGTVVRRAPALAGALVVVAAAAGWWTFRPGVTVDAGPIRSLAVLPLENLSGDPEQEYVADGMTEELIGELAKLRDLRVISRTSVMRYKQTPKSIPEIAAELGVEGALEGTVTREQGRIRVTVQLIDARTDTHLWADRFDREVSSVLALRSDVARAVAEQLHLELRPEEEAALRESRSVDPEAYDAFLRALQLRGPEQLFSVWGPQVHEQLERAVQLDPDFAEAWTGLALIRNIWGWFDRDKAQGAREAVERALALGGGDRLGVAYTTLSQIRLHYDWDYAGALEACERGAKLSPGDPLVLGPYAWCLLRAGRTEEALRVSESHLRVAPFDRFTWEQRVKVLVRARLYERAIEEAERARKLDPTFVEIDERQAYLMLGRFADSYRVELARMKLCGAPCEWERTAYERGWTKGGMEGLLRAWLEAATKAPSGTIAATPFVRAVVYAEVGDTEQAFAWLERAYRERDPMLVITLTTLPTLDPLRIDPRYQDLVRRIGFPDNGDDTPVLAELGRALAFAQRPDEAIARLEMAMRLRPADERLPRWLDSMSMAHFAAGRYEQAADWAQRVLATDVSTNVAAFAHLLLASSYAHLDRADAATREVEEALRLWPGLQIDRDLRPLFMAGSAALRDRYLEGLGKAGLASR